MSEWPTMEEAEKRAKELIEIGKRTLIDARLCPICGSALNHHHFLDHSPPAPPKEPKP